MTTVEETALAQILSVCADSGLKLSRIFGLAKSTLAGLSKPKTKQLKKIVKLYQESLVSSRLSKSDIETVISKRKNGEAPLEIAKCTGLSLSTVYYVLASRYAGAPADGHNFPPTGEKRGRPKGSTKRHAL